MIDDPITIPAASVYPGDLMDQALDKLRVVHLALSPESKSLQGDAQLFACWATIEGIIRDLEPVRNRLQLPGERAAS